MKIHLLNYLLEASVCLAVFYAFYYLVLRKERFFAYNRIFILLALLLSLLIPVMEIPLSQQAIYISQQPAIDRYVAYIPLEAAEKPADSVASQGSEVSSAGLWDFVLYGYGVVAFLFLIRLFFQVKHLHSLAKGGIKEEEYTLIPTAGQLSTFSFFRWLFWDDTQALPAEEKNLILAHELVHIRQKHSWDTMFLEVLKIIFWFHPAIYLFKKSLQEVHEYLADQAVLYQHDGNLYTNLLARQHLRKLSVSFTHSFNQPQITKRIAMIQSASKSPKPAFWKTTLALPVIAALLVLYSCKMNEPETTLPFNGQVDIENTYELPAMGMVAGSTLFNEENYRYGHYPKQDLDQGAYPVDGMPAYQNYMQKILKEPAGAPPLKTRRKVYVMYTVNENGDVRNPTILNGIGGEYDKAALEIFKHSPKWIPAVRNGVPVSSTMVWPVTFGQMGLFQPFHPDIKALTDTPVEGEPVPHGGLQAYTDRLRGLQYPLDARSNLVEGSVVIGFTVEANGEPGKYEVLKQLYPSLDQEALRMVKSATSGLWKPAIRNGKPQKSKVVMRCIFGLSI